MKNPIKIEQVGHNIHSKNKNLPSGKMLKVDKSSEIQVDDRKIILEHLIHGSIGIDSPKVFLQLIDQYPREPFLHRYYADLLLKSRLNDTAAKSYGTAAELFIEAGMMLQAIVAKIFQWRIRVPIHQEAQLFISDLKNCSFKDTRLNNFFARLSPLEMISFFSIFEMVKFPAGYRVKTPGDAENDLFFIVSGQIRDSIYLTVENTRKVYRRPTILLSENDFFGDIYPFDEEKRCPSYIETVSHAELVRIPKLKLIKTCRNDFNIELGLIELLKIRSECVEQDLYHRIRNAPRYKVEQQLDVHIYPEDPNTPPASLIGYSQDISIGGMGIILDPDSINSSFNDSNFCKSLNNAKTKICLLVETLSINISGKVVWNQQVLYDGQKTLAIGVQFDEISPKTGGILLSLLNNLEPDY